MIDQWYYAHGEGKHGPFSSQQLKDLATAGTINPTDTVWKHGIERGIVASRVKYLFDPVIAADNVSSTTPQASAAPAPLPVPPIKAELAPIPVVEIIAPQPEVAEIPLAPQLSLPATLVSVDEQAVATPQSEATSPVAEGDQVAKPTPPRSQPIAQKKGRASVVSGAIITSQDGTSVQFRKKCTKCGHEDAAKSRMVIRNGVTRATFFCRVCRKLMKVELHGSL